MECTHDRFEFREEREHDMHCWGWVCLNCDHLATGECHHQSWCREDFCGAEPLSAEVPGPSLIGA